MTELHVPDVAVERLRACVNDARSHSYQPDDFCVRDVSKPVVAAELRRLIDQIYRDEVRTVHAVARLLDRRAAELDPPR